jgi:hypothetical protein
MTVSIGPKLAFVIIKKMTPGRKWFKNFETKLKITFQKVFTVDILHTCLSVVQLEKYKAHK